MAKLSAGVLLVRHRPGGAGTHAGNLEVFLVHPGGPFWAKKDEGSWSIPKGEYEEGEDALAAARREFEEETGFPAPGDPAAYRPLQPLKQPSGKVIAAWAVEGDCDASAIRSNTFAMEWPPHSGKTQEFPEVDRAGWFTIEEARTKVFKGQHGFLDQLVRMLAK